ncbi:MAG: primosomal protein N' [Bacillota bacterium]
MQKLYANVVINKASRWLDKTFQYSIPDHLNDLAVVGSLVLVPFGKTLEYGYILELSSIKEHPTLKAIDTVLSPEFNLNEEEIKLAEWICDYYLAPKIKCLKLLTPAAAFPAKVKEFKILNGENNFNTLSEKAGVLYNKLKVYGSKWVKHQKFKSNFPKMMKEYLELVSKGYVMERYTLHEPAKRTDWNLIKPVLNISQDKLTEYMEKFYKKAPQQYTILDYLSKGCNVSVQELQVQTGIDMAIIRKLEEKGLIKFSDIKMDTHSHYKSVSLNNDQLMATNLITKNINDKVYNPYLLFGVTGSGKTEVYMELIEQCLKRGMQSILLLPEIFLTMQIVKRLVKRFGNQLVILHSMLTARERFEAWKAVKFGQKKVIVGARSAIFAPVSNLGIIIVDEEHDTSYKQESDPKYNAKEVAIKRAIQHKCPVIFGSATPSIETFYAAEKGKIKLLSLPNRANDLATLAVKVVDMRAELRKGNPGIFCSELVEEMQNAFKNGKQVILYLNRRGYASFVLCYNCGYVITCENCEVSLTYHQPHRQMVCHYCGFNREIPSRCPKCNSSKWKPFGLGTQKVEHEFKKLFPDIKVVRIDGDSAGKKDKVLNWIDDFAAGKIQALIGTQMIAKGMDFPNITVVGIVAADMTLNIPDFRSRERSFQLLTQVAGRAGRGDWQGKVIIQTFNPDDLSIIHSKKQDYLSFYQGEIKFRRECNYSPFTQIIRIVFTSKEETVVRESALIFYSYLKEHCNNKLKSVEILGPSPCGLVKLNKEYRWNLILKVAKGVNLKPGIKKAVEDFYGKEAVSKKLMINIDVSPTNFA